MRTSILGRVICGSLFAALLSFPSLQAQQSATGSIVGTVTDPSGTPVAHVPITLTNASQGTVHTFTTRNDGMFSFSTLEAANYTLSTPSSSGFAGWREAVSLDVGQSLNIPVRLDLAGNRTTVEVTSDSQLGVNTTSSDLGGVIESRQIETLPLNGRNYLELAYLVPGNAPAPNFDPTKENTVVVSSAGQVGRGGNVTIDGADNNDDAVGGSLVNIPEDAVQEFQIASNRFSAGLGRSGSTVVNVVTKQGGNKLHGGVGVYERDRVSAGTSRHLSACSRTDSGVPSPTVCRGCRWAVPPRQSLVVCCRLKIASSSAPISLACATPLTRPSTAPFATAPLHDYPDDRKARLAA